VRFRAKRNSLTDQKPDDRAGGANGEEDGGLKASY
jgi:hypothetical protein